MKLPDNEEAAELAVMQIIKDMRRTHIEVDKSPKKDVHHVR